MAAILRTISRFQVLISSRHVARPKSHYARIPPFFGTYPKNVLLTSLEELDLAPEEKSFSDSDEQWLDGI